MHVRYVIVSFTDLILLDQDGASRYGLSSVNRPPDMDTQLSYLLASQFTQHFTLITYVINSSQKLHT